MSRTKMVRGNSPPNSLFSLKSHKMTSQRASSQCWDAFSRNLQPPFSLPTHFNNPRGGSESCRCIPHQIAFWIKTNKLGKENEPRVIRRTTINRKFQEPSHHVPRFRIFHSAFCVDNSFRQRVFFDNKRQTIFRGNQPCKQRQTHRNRHCSRY